MITINKTMTWSVAGIGAILLACGGSYFYQNTHFNKNVQINGVNVGGLSVKKATQKVQSTPLNNSVYLDNKLIFKGQEKVSEASQVSETDVKQVFSKQFSFFPSSKDINYQINGTNENNYRKTTLKNAVQAKLVSANETRTAPVDAYAQLKDGKVSVVNAKKGNLYDIDKIMKEYDSQLNDNQIKLSTAYVQPLSADSKKIATDKAKLSELSKQKIDYKVQDKTYQLAAADVINSATIKDGKFSFNTEKLNKKIAAINKAQGTLNKNLKFHTTNGNNITLEKGSYGWALSEKKAAKTITTAFKEKKSSVDAKDDTYGEGYNTKGTGYSVTSNNGIGDNYVEISLAQQHVWVYRNGKQVASINIVSGTNDGYYNTPKGLYYVMYKQTNTVLRGRNADNSAYASPVSRWAPFTLDGCGFHDASWRSNWSSTAYLSNGSHGCINIRPSQVNMVYDNITENEPVVIY